MDRLACPHCNETRLGPRRPPGDIVLMNCPQCGEMVIMFRKKVVALDRSILEEGSPKRRRTHLADVIAEFLDPDVLDFDWSDLAGGLVLRLESTQEVGAEEDGDLAPPEDASVISEAELRLFARDELSKLDDSDYFRRHFS